MAIDWDLLRAVFSWLFFLAGGFSVVVAAIGLVRFPDFYTRMHAAGITDTAGATLIVAGMLLQAPSWIVAVKLAFIVAFLALTSPVATHAVAHSAWMVGFRPLEGPELRRREDGGGDGA